ncbi:hypothetical protein [Nocardioides sp. B-3]|uniref:hypothetical protein n=1 Tax=Nocardioides sp. B-3 TaxID=2895565 RepID=UPI0021529429|nr:hypothetical protein [Nocardioides sp. B-3]UUZ59978.1 hypothetical protein LP418_02850 [Nocardioides sp. B-3]
MSRVGTRLDCSSVRASGGTGSVGVAVASVGCVSEGWLVGDSVGDWVALDSVGSGVGEPVVAEVLGSVVDGVSVGAVGVVVTEPLVVGAVVGFLVGFPVGLVVGEEVVVVDPVEVGDVGAGAVDVGVGVGVAVGWAVGLWPGGRRTPLCRGETDVAAVGHPETGGADVGVVPGAVLAVGPEEAPVGVGRWGVHAGAPGGDAVDSADEAGLTLDPCQREAGGGDDLVGRPVGAVRHARGLDAAGRTLEVDDDRHPRRGRARLGAGGGRGPRPARPGWPSS